MARQGAKRPKPTTTITFVPYLSTAHPAKGARKRLGRPSARDRAPVSEDENLNSAAASVVKVASYVPMIRACTNPSARETRSRRLLRQERIGKVGAVLFPFTRSYSLAGRSLSHSVASSVEVCCCVCTVPSRVPLDS